MRPETWLARWRGLDPWMRGALCVYLVLTVATCARSALAPHRQSVYPIWKLAGHDWRTGHDLYDHSRTADPIRWGYRYSPLVAALFTGADFVPLWLGGVVWRVVSVGIFLAAVEWWLRRGLPFDLTEAQRGMAHLLVAPFALGSLNNGQFNLVLIALMLLAVTAIGLERWNLAALCLAGAILLKIYPIALAGLLLLAYPRRLGPRLALAMVLLVGLPFLMQEPGYVLRQYQLWYDKVADGDVGRRSWPLAEGYRDAWLVIRAWEVPVSLALYTRLQLAGGGVCAMLSALAAFRLGRGPETRFVILSLAAGWMILLGPSPESCTYVLVAPTLAVWLLTTSPGRFGVAHYLAVAGYGLLALCFVAGTYSPAIRLYQASGLQPIGVMLYSAGFLGAVVVRILRPSRARQATVEETNSLARAA